ncbi:MAG: DNA recombination protein RmuC, partial [Flavobacteriaceae bacterium]|nr:DNA recombination protein RmuC [Flavobacteriaceae bacterium]
MIEFIISLISIAIGVFVGRYISKLKFEKETSTLEERQRLATHQKTELENKVLHASNEKEELRKEKELLVIENTKLVSELENLKVKLTENKQEVEKLQEKFTKEFENLANRILDEKSTKFTAQNKENMQMILNPLQEKIKLFEDKVDQTH